MPFTPDMNSTPPGYMTPAQIQQMYGYAGELTKGGLRDKEITSPWQGARMMADALSGNIMRNRAGGAQQQNAGLLGNLQTGAAIESQPGGSGEMPSPSATPGTPPPMQPPRPPFASMAPAPPIAGLGGSVPGVMPGSPPGGPPGMQGGMQPQNPMMSALMSQPPMPGMPGMGMS